MRQGLKVIDGDGHLQEPMDMWENYMPQAFAHRAPNIIGHTGKIIHKYGPCEIYPEGKVIASDESTFSHMEERYGEAYRSWWSMPERLKDMDREGIDVAVAFPTNCQLLGSNVWAKDPELHAALVTAYNNWAIDYCSDSGGRVKAIAHATSKDAEAGVAEIYRMAESPHIAGIFHPSMEIDNSWGDEAYEPFWQAIEETGIPVCWHGSASHPLAQSFDPIRKKYGALNHALMHPVGAMLALGGMIYGGVLEKYPNLKAAFYESNAGWLPFWLARLDDHTEGRQGVFLRAHAESNGNVGLMPTEYFKRQCFIACDADEGALKQAVEYMDGENIIFNTDYPHPDAPFPGAVDAFLDQPISREHMQKILWDNSVRLYGDKIPQA